MSDSISPRSSSSSWVTIAAAIGGFAIFIAILLVSYLPKRPDALPAGDSVKTPEQRKTALTEMHAKEKAASTTYAWVDQPNGIVRIPTERAVKLTLEEINSKK